MRLRAFLRDPGGAAAAEMALVLPGIAFILLNVVDISLYIFTRMQVDLAAHEAVGAARVLCDADSELPATVNCGGTLNSTMTGAAQSTSLGSGVSVDGTAEEYFCANATGELVSVAAASGTPPADCTAVVAGSAARPGIYIRTTASYTFAPLFPGASVAAILPGTISRTAWIRLK